MVKKLTKDVADFGKGAVVIGVSGGVVAGVTAASGVAGLGGMGTGINTVAGFTPIVGLGIGAGAALRGVKGLRGKKKRKGIII